MMRYGWEYVKKTEAECATQVKARLEKSLHRRAKELGYELVKIAAPLAEPMPAMVDG